MMKKVFYWVGGIGSFILLLISIKTTPNAFEWLELSMYSYPNFFINWAMYEIVYLLMVFLICFWLRVLVEEPHVSPFSWETVCRSY